MTTPLHTVCSQGPVITVKEAIPTGSVRRFGSSPSAPQHPSLKRGDIMEELKLPRVRAFDPDNAALLLSTRSTP